VLVGCDISSMMGHAATFLSIVIIAVCSITGVISFSILPVLSESRQRQRIILVIRDSHEKSIHSYVEGSSQFDNEMDEIEAMGGDPFFLTEEAIVSNTISDDNDDDLDSSPLSSSSFSMLSHLELDGIVGNVEERYATDGKGPTPASYKWKPAENDDFVWDGIADDDAHLGLD
jgi:hypothetical protein